MEKKDVKVFILAGKARSGKDTTANYIKEYFEEKGLKVINLQFSFYIKMYAKFICDWDGSDETKPRTLLQQLGTEVIRTNIDKYFFIKRLIEDINVCSYYADVITISDSRVPEELDEIKKAYPNTIKIGVFRPDLNSELTGAEQKHLTEIALDNYTDYDYKIINDSTLDDLKDKVTNILNNCN